MDWVFDIINLTKREGFTGSIQLNFFKGKIANINKVETIPNPEYKKPSREQ